MTAAGCDGQGGDGISSYDRSAMLPRGDPRRPVREVVFAGHCADLSCMRGILSG